MKFTSLLMLSIGSAGPLLAEGNRSLSAHEHGVGKLNIAFEGSTVVMEFHAPGADIVGFEYSARSADDYAAIDAGIAKLSDAQSLFIFSKAAACTVVEAHASLESKGAHMDHETEHEGHADDHSEDHSRKAAGHSEFHATFNLTCANPTAISGLTFGYFDAFPNAVEVDVQAISSKGAVAFEVSREAPHLDLDVLF